MVGNEIRSRLALLGKRQVDLIAALHCRGYDVAPSTLSSIISGRRGNEKIENEIWDIVKGWEGEKHGH